MKVTASDVDDLLLAAVVRPRGRPLKRDVARVKAKSRVRSLKAQARKCRECGKRITGRTSMRQVNKCIQCSRMR